MAINGIHATPKVAPKGLDAPPASADEPPLTKAATTLTPSVVPDAIRRLDWVHETIGTMISDAPYVEVDVLASGVLDARAAAELLESGPGEDGFDLTAAAAAARGVEELVQRAHDLVASAGDAESVAPQVVELGEQAETFVHAAFQALGTDRD